MSEYGLQPGQSAPVKTKTILASSDGYIPKNITILATAEDVTNVGNVKVLRAGVVLVPLNATANKGKYVVFNSAGTNGQELEKDAVVLTDEYKLDGVSDCLASAAIAGHIYRDELKYSGTFVFANAPGTLRFSDRYYY